MKYMLLIYGNETTWNELYGDAFDDVMREHEVLAAELAASDEFVESQGLTTRGAMTVRVRDDTATVTDGPFTEAKEVLAGYYLVDCADAERAADIAARIPEARFDLVEVRRVMDPSEFGT
ncbi:YciI family protein [Haloactinopolyspora sp.]|uniref:YciI family protein n=1 Tax=Haloactinopolyspora sp. TaxID=1966353 RepID=UPI00260B3D22|nr:YciI family protein [Haloactinopolyspora sp.]